MDLISNNERLIFATSTHWVKYVRSIFLSHLFLILGLILLITAGIASVQTVTLITYFIGLLLVLFAHHSFFHKIMSESMLDIFVTNDRIIYFDDNLFLCDDEHEIPLEKVASVKMEQHGLVRNILDYGILWFDTGGGAIDLMRSIPNVPHPDSLSAIIAKVLRDQRQGSFSQHNTSTNTSEYVN